MFKLNADNHVVPALPTDYNWKIFCNRYTHPGTDTRGMFYKKIYTGKTDPVKIAFKLSGMFLIEFQV